MEAGDLRKLARDKIVAEGGKALDATGEAAAALLAELSAVGLAHGVSPQDWAWVPALPAACWDASRELAARRRTAIDRSRQQEPWVTAPSPGLRADPERPAGPPPSPVRRGPSR